MVWKHVSVETHIKVSLCSTVFVAPREPRQACDRVCTRQHELIVVTCIMHIICIPTCATTLALWETQKLMQHKSSESHHQ